VSGPEIIRRYIWAMKRVDIGGIAEPVTPLQVELYQRALSYALMWWANGGMNEPGPTNNEQKTNK
jgi:hypothetical protein